MADEQKKDDALTPERIHRFTWNTGDIVWDDEDGKDEAIHQGISPNVPADAQSVDATDEVKS